MNEMAHLRVMEVCGVIILRKIDRLLLLINSCLFLKNGGVQVTLLATPPPAIFSAQKC